MNESYTPNIEGVPAEHVGPIVDAGLQFLRAITEAYGPEKGQEVWDSITNTLGPNVKGAIFFAMLTGHCSQNVRFVAGPQKTNNQVNVIRAIRIATDMGLKDAKDLSDLAEGGMHQTVTVIGGFRERDELVRVLRQEGMSVY